MSRKSRRIRRWLVLGVAVGALGITATAQAFPVVEGGSGQPSTQTQYWTAVNNFWKKQARENAGVLPGLTPASQPYVQAVASLTPDQLRATFGTEISGLAGSQSGSTATGSDGFNWGDFAIGIGVALGAILIAAVLAQLARTSRSRRGLATLH
jgi:hypothetical protein